jgi:hypothetical protein
MGGLIYSGDMDYLATSSDELSDPLITQVVSDASDASDAGDADDRDHGDLSDLSD